MHARVLRRAPCGSRRSPGARGAQCARMARTGRAGDSGGPCRGGGSPRRGPRLVRRSPGGARHAPHPDHAVRRSGHRRRARRSRFRWLGLHRADRSRIPHVLGEPGRAPRSIPAGRAVRRNAGRGVARRAARCRCLGSGPGEHMGAEHRARSEPFVADDAVTGAAAEARRARPDEFVGGALLLATSVLFGAVVVLGKVAGHSGLAVASLLAFRFAVAAAILAAALIVLRRPLAAAKGEGGRLLALGVAGYAVASGLFFAALPHGTVPAVTLLFFTYPVFVAVIAAASGKGLPGWLLGAALAAAVAGAAVVVIGGGRAAIDPTGVGFALGSALMFSLYLLGADAVLRRTD